MSRLVPVFWTIAALDAAVLLAMFVVTFRHEGHQDGGREMALFFYVMLPAAALLLTMLLFAFCHVRLVRVAALLVVLSPALFWVWQRVDDERIDRRIASNRSGAGYFRVSALRAMAVAVVDRDVATLRRIGPDVDVNTIGKRDMTLLRLAVDRDVNGVPPPSDAAEVPVVTALLALGARPDTALAVATKRPDPTLLRLLLEAGADANLRPPGQQAVVFEWFTVMKPDALRLLIAHGLDPNTRQGDEPMAVLFTIYRRWDLLAALIDLGANIDAPRADGRNVRAELAAQLLEASTDGKAPEADLALVAARLGVRPAAPP